MKLLYYTVTGWKELNNKNMHKTSLVIKIMLFNSYLFTDIVSFRMLGLVKACNSCLIIYWLGEENELSCFPVASQLISLE